MYWLGVLAGEIILVKDFGSDEIQRQSRDLESCSRNSSIYARVQHWERPRCINLINGSKFNLVMIIWLGWQNPIKDVNCICVRLIENWGSGDLTELLNAVNRFSGIHRPQGKTFPLFQGFSFLKCFLISRLWKRTHNREEHSSEFTLALWASPVTQRPQRWSRVGPNTYRNSYISHVVEHLGRLRWGQVSL